MPGLIERLRERIAHKPGSERPGAPCSHLEAATADVEPLSQECGSCHELGIDTWVDLRLCLSCGEVGCCDSSPYRHASEHAATAGHPVVRSFEHGETWRWCYVDEMLG